MQTLTTFLMFQGQAEEAMNFYLGLFPGSKITHIKKYETTDGNNGKVMLAGFTLNGKEFLCIDSPVKHDFDFTASISIYVNTDSEAELDALYKAFTAGGKILMPMGAYPFSKKYAWVADQFGVAWQLNLAGDATTA